MREAAYLRRAFPRAATWPPQWPLFFVQLHEGEELCHERTDAPELLEKLGNVNETCPPLQLRPGQLRTLKAKHFHLGASEAELRAWLAPHAHEPLLYFGRMFRRFHRFSSAQHHADFSRRFAWGVQPAPEIRTVAAQALQRLRNAVGGGAFNCVHMRRCAPSGREPYPLSHRRGACCRFRRPPSHTLLPPPPAARLLLTLPVPPPHRPSTPPHLQLSAPPLLLHAIHALHPSTPRHIGQARLRGGPRGRAVGRGVRAPRL